MDFKAQNAVFRDAKGQLTGGKPIGFE